MMRMIRMELVVLNQYLKQLSFSILFMAACFAVGLGNTASLLGFTFMMGMFNLTNSSSNYDERNDWAAFRLTMPVSRRDVVLGRYLFVLTGALIVSGLVAAAAVALSMLGEASLLPEAVANVVRIDKDALQAGAMTLAYCGAMGFVIASVAMPVFFKFGQTKATQWLPIIMMFLGIAPFLIVGIMGDGALAALDRILSFTETPDGLTAYAVGALVFGLACYVVSALISLRVYKARDL